MIQAGTTSSSEAAIQIFLDEVSTAKQVLHESRQSEIGTLLVDFCNAKERWAEQNRQQIKDFLGSQPIQDLYQEHLKRLMQSGERFNIFSALWLDRRENYHSRFIAYLLDPRAHHDQGAKFLRCFFDKLGIEDPSSLSVASVTAEYSVGELGRLDLVISTPQSIIVIENKIDAGEQEDQISRYRKWLDDNHHGRKQRLLFLTPTGSPPTTGKADLNWSYRKVIEWLDDSLKGIPETAIPVRAVVEQYKRICLSIADGGYSMQKIDNETFNLLTRDKNLAVALDIATKLEGVKERIRAEFVKVVKEKLLGFIDKDPKWCVAVNPTENGGWISLRTLAHTNNARNYQCHIDCLFGTAKIGWNRPAWIDLKTENLDTVALSNEMKKKDYWPENWWVGCKGFEPDLNVSDNETIVHIFNDNISEIHPLAQQVADVLWETFQTYRGQIEELESFKTASS